MHNAVYNTNPTIVTIIGMRRTSNGFTPGGWPFTTSPEGTGVILAGAGVLVMVGVSVNVGVTVLVGVGVCVGVTVLVGVADGVMVGVRVGVGVGGRGVLVGRGVSV